MKTLSFLHSSAILSLCLATLMLTSQVAAQSGSRNAVPAPGSGSRNIAPAPSVVPQQNYQAAPSYSVPNQTYNTTPGFNTTPTYQAAPSYSQGQSYAPTQNWSAPNAGCNGCGVTPSYNYQSYPNYQSWPRYSSGSPRYFSQPSYGRGLISPSNSYRYRRSYPSGCGGY